MEVHPFASVNCLAICHGVPCYILSYVCFFPSSELLALSPVHKLDNNVFYQSTPSTSHVSIPFPGAPELASFYQGCVDQWAAQGFDYTITGRLVVDNLWQPLYEAHCLRDTCGCTIFERTNVTERCEDGLRCGESVACVCLLQLCFVASLLQTAVQVSDLFALIKVGCS